MIIQTRHERAALREGGSILARVLAEVSEASREGVTTQELDLLAEKRVKTFGGTPSFKGYRVSDAESAYPATLCVSINDEIVHGIPSDRVLQNEDVVGLDIGMKYKGYFTDTAVTLIVGFSEKNKTKLEAKHLLDATRKALEIGIKEVRAGVRVGTVGNAIQLFLESQKFGVVRELVGHGVGNAVHEDPEIPNWGQKDTGYALKEGEVIALEPMATLGSPKVKLLKDGWTWSTRDGSLAAHFEHTLIVTKDGAEVITKA